MLIMLKAMIIVLSSWNCTIININLSSNAKDAKKVLKEIDPQVFHLVM